MSENVKSGNEQAKNNSGERKNQNQGQNQQNRSNGKYNGNRNRNNHYKKGNYHKNSRTKLPVEETLDDIAADIARIEKEIQLEIQEITTMRLGI